MSRTASPQQGVSRAGSLLLLVRIIPVVIILCSVSAIATTPSAPVTDQDIEALQQQVSRYPYETALRKKLVDAYVASGQQLLTKSRYEEAAQRFAGACEYFPDDPQLRFLLGIARFLARDLDAAKVEFDRTRALGGDNAVLYRYRGEVAYAAGDLSGALAEWEEAQSREADEKLRVRMEKVRKELQTEGKMGKGASSRFFLSYDPTVSRDLADGILDVLETAYNVVGSDLDRYPTTQVQVLLYSQEDYRQVTGSPRWSAGQYDGKIRIPVKGLENIPPPLRGVIFHEYTHVVVGDIAPKNVPVWLNEGLAEREGRKEFDPPLVELERAFRGGSLLPFRGLAQSFPTEGRVVRLAYEQSYSFVRFIASRYGEDTLRQILTRLGAGDKADAAMAATFGLYGTDFDTVVQEWRDSLQKELVR